jgi:hypothetical protein
LALFSLLYAIQVGIAIWWLSWIAQVLSNS